MVPGPQRDILRAMRRSHIGLLVAAWLLSACVPTLKQRPHRAPRPGPEGVEPASDGVGASAPELHWRTLGYSVQGRPLRAAALGFGPRKVLWIGGIHGNEPEGRVATQQLPAAFLRERGAERAVTLTILEDANPDGSAMQTRGNANGVDLNRNFPADNFLAQRQFGNEPLSQSESRAVHELILRLQPDLVIVAHSWRGDHFINYDGPGEAVALRFSRLSSYPLRRSGDMAATPGSLGSWVGRKLGVPILTLEYLRGRDPWSAWQETRVAILRSILAGDDGGAASPIEGPNG